MRFTQFILAFEPGERDDKLHAILRKIDSDELIIRTLLYVIMIVCRVYVANKSALLTRHLDKRS